MENFEKHFLSLKENKDPKNSAEDAGSELATQEEALETESFAESNINRFFENLILEGQRINEGQNGVIVKIDFGQENLPEDIREHIEKEAPDLLNGESVAKILKIYTATHAGREEFEKQRKAYEITNNAREEKDRPIAKVPKPLLYKDLDLDDDAQAHLKNLGVNAQDKAEMFLMEYAPGKDIATTLYAQLLKNHPSAKHLQHEDIDNWDFEELHKEVSSIFFYKAAENSDAAERAVAEDRISRQNSEILQKELASIGLQIDPGIITTIKNTIQTLREEGMLLADAHERNFMIEGDITNGGEITVVDYGEAKLLDHPVTDADLVDETQGVRYRSDLGTVHFLEGINQYFHKKQAKESAEPWYTKDPLGRKVNAHIMTKAGAFRHNRPEDLGFTRSNKPNDPKINAFEKSLHTALEEYQDSKTFDVDLFFKNLRDENGKRIALKRERDEKSNIWNENALLSGMLYKIYEAYSNEELSKEDVGNILATLQNNERFSKVFEDEQHYRYWNGIDLANDIPEMFDKFKQVS